MMKVNKTIRPRGEKRKRQEVLASRMSFFVDQKGTILAEVIDSKGVSIEINSMGKESVSRVELPIEVRQNKKIGDKLTKAELKTKLKL